MDDVLGSLSRRERQVFKLLILGHSNGEIAGLLALSVRTVETHRANMQRKLGLATRSALVRLALERGYFANLEAVAP
jgi:DNA-binding CsgD family transcriptional regulator